MKGSEFGASILSLGGEAREHAILQATMSESALPSWFRGTWPLVKLGPRLSIFAAPDYFSIGEDADFLRMTMTPMTAAVLARRYRCFLPTRKMVAAIYAAAQTKLPGMPVPPDTKMETTARLIEHNKTIEAQLKGKQGPGQNNLIAGHKKDIVIGPDLDGSRVAIYGWQPDPKVFPHQPYSTIHGSTYADYSHGVRFIASSAMLDDKVVLLYEVFRDPQFVELVSDQGQFVPQFPNKGLGFASPESGINAGGALAGAAVGGAVGGPVGAVLGGIAGAMLK